MAWRPTATLATLELRARILGQIRAFFAERGVLEVETPSLSRAGVTDPALTSVTATVGALARTPMYLQTSPEFAMKRLLAAGSGDIYQICRVYRDAEIGPWHSPEFTMLEWYRVGWDDRALIRETATLLGSILGGTGRQLPVVELSYDDAFTRFLGASAEADRGALEAALTGHGVPVPAGLPRRGLLDLALGTIVVPALSRTALTFIYDFPADQAALARVKPTDPPVAARFEAFFAGLELANGFWELTDAAEQRARFEADLEARRRAGQPLPVIDTELLAALEHGLPDCAGIAVGLDRLVAAAADLASLEEAMAFAHRRDD